MSFDISGRVTEIFPTQQVTDKFKKREFVIEIKESNNSGFEFVELIKFQAVQDKCALLDTINLNDTIKISFNLRGRKWEKQGQVSYFTNLDAWKIEKEQSTNDAPITSDDPGIDKSNTDAPFSSEPPVDDSGYNDLPF